MNKKIDLFINGIYICSSQKYTTCKSFLEAIKKQGFITWASLPKNGFYKIQKNDKITCKYAKH